jgi:murein DD-endopeptidase MepM/ murein hydrolase activator NlpD
VAVSPTQAGWVGGGYGPRRCNSSAGECFHGGWDFTGSRGDPVFAADAGTVYRTFRNEDSGSGMRGYSNVVVLDHGDGTWSSYNHLDSIAVSQGQRVAAGELLGTIGSTTNGRYPIAPHLHFEVRRSRPNGSAPFPGPYGRFDLDPGAWFETRGMMAARTPGLLRSAPRDLSGNSYQPPTSEMEEFRSVWDAWGRAIVGLAGFNLVYRVASGEWLIFRPFEAPRRRRVRRRF